MIVSTQSECAACIASTIKRKPVYRKNGENMNTKEQSKIYQVLHPRRQAITDAWLATITKISATASEIPDLPAQLLKATEQLVALLLSEPFDAHPAQKIGEALEILDNLQPESLIQVHETLARELVAGLPPEQIAALQLRVVGLISALNVGFFVGKAKRAKTFDTNAMSRMGHDLKTPINAITGFSRVILKGIDGPITEFQQQDLTSIYDAGQKLLTMIDELFRTAKTDAAKTNLYAATFDIADLIGDVLQVSQPIIARYDHTLEVRCIGELGTMHADASQVRWVLLSLLYHTARLTTNSTISLSVIRESIQDLDWFFFEITVMLPDNISERERLLAELTAGNPEQGDADIALITSKRFCEALGGNLLEERGKNWLTKFTVRLPAR